MYVNLNMWKRADRVLVFHFTFERILCRQITYSSPQRSACRRGDIMDHYQGSGE